MHNIRKELKGRINITERECSRIFGESVGTLRRKRVSGEGVRFRKVGSRVMYDVEECINYYCTPLQKSTTETGVKR